jgi:hypothetical protein
VFAGRRFAMHGILCWTAAILASLCTGTSLAESSGGASLITRSDQFVIGRVKYGGGGDWYNGPSSIPNLLRFIHEQTGITTASDEEVVELSNPSLFSCPFLFLDGHGNVRFTDREVEELRRYLESGGFLLANDDYGMDKSFRREMKRVVPESDFVELPFNHPIYSSCFNFPNGCPKIHEHDGLPAQGFGLFIKGKLVVYYDYQADIGDGWEDPDVHKDPPDKRLAALKMGTNVAVWRLRGGE